MSEKCKATNLPLKLAKYDQSRISWSTNGFMDGLHPCVLQPHILERFETTNTKMKG